MRRLGAIAVGLALALSACRKKAHDPEPPAGDAPAPKSADAPAPPEARLDLLAQIERCEIRHRGLSIDAGTRAADYRRGYSIGPFDDVDVRERGGETFLRLLSRQIAYEVWLDEAASDVVLSARVRGSLARSVRLSLDDRLAGSAPVVRDETKIVSFAVKGEVAAGRHVVSVDFPGKLGATEEASGEVDWIRVSGADDTPATYAAPTLRDVVSDVTLDGRPRRALAVRAPGSIRCPVRVVAGSKLVVDVGFWGTGHGVAEVRVLEDGRDPVVLHTARPAGGSGAKWSPLEISLDAFATRVVGIELRVESAVGVGRVAFAEPAVVAAPPSNAREPETKTVVVVVASGIRRRMIPPWGPVEGVPALAELARSGVAFSEYRIPTPLATGVVATLLTGVSPPAHGVEDPGARLPTSTRTIAEMIKEASGHTAFFTGVPTSFEAFGFRRGWDRFDQISPVADASATEPYRRAAEWLREQLDQNPDARRLVVVHARGTHPPWDVSLAEAAMLPPEDYEGVIDARRGAMVLAKIRGSRVRAARRLSPGDWQRLEAFQTATLRKEALGIDDLFHAIQDKGAWDQTLFVVVGDVGQPAPPGLPYAPLGDLDEDELLAPLIVKLPGGALAGKRADLPVTTADLTYTILRALGLALPEGVHGQDLRKIAAGVEMVDAPALVATLGNRYSTRWSQWILSGELRQKPTLCQLDVDPSCSDDVFDQHPIVATALWKRTYDAEAEARGAPSRLARRLPAKPDEDTVAALAVWGH